MAIHMRVVYAAMVYPRIVYTDLDAFICER
jgi:hypothetical protein